MIQAEFILLDICREDGITSFFLFLATHCFLSWKIKLKKYSDVIYISFYHLSSCQAWQHLRASQFSLLPPVNWLSDKDFNWNQKKLQSHSVQEQERDGGYRKRMEVYEREEQGKKASYFTLNCWDQIWQ